MIHGWVGESVLRSRPTSSDLVKAAAISCLAPHSEPREQPLVRRAVDLFGLEPGSGSTHHIVRALYTSCAKPFHQPTSNGLGRGESTGLNHLLRLRLAYAGACRAHVTPGDDESRQLEFGEERPVVAPPRACVTGGRAYASAWVWRWPWPWRSASKQRSAHGGGDEPATKEKTACLEEASAAPASHTSR